MLNVPQASWPVRFIAQVTDGAAKPVGGDSEQTIRLTTRNVESAARRATPRAITGAGRARRRTGAQREQAST